MPTNKIGKLKAGQGLRRIHAQKLSGWRDEYAKANYEIGRELEPDKSSPDRATRASRWNGAND
jgi:hypothetical protein